MANYFQIFPPLVFSYRLFIFTNRGKFQARTWVWRKFAAENRVNFQRGDWTGVKWSSQSRETNFLTLPDLAFGFVHKRSGNEITSQSSFCFVISFPEAAILLVSDGIAWPLMTPALVMTCLVQVRKTETRLHEPSKISKFSAPTIAFLAFLLAKKLRLWANSRSFTSYGK